MNNIIKTRIGEAFDSTNNRTLYQIQFKLDGEHKFMGFSFDMFQTKEQAEKALELHSSGERPYSYFNSAYTVKQKMKGNKLNIYNKLEYHVMAASKLPESIVWVDVKDEY